MTHREHIEWSDVWIEAANGTPLRRGLLVGDSITQSYYPRVSESLAGAFVCARFATSKCVCDPLFLKELGLILGAYNFAVIHFNNGLHGQGYDESAYATSLLQALDFVTATSGNSRLILGNSTPVWQPGRRGILDPITDRVRVRNRIVATLAASRGVVVNDLFGAVIDHPEYVAADGVHFNREGQDVLGKLVAQAIRGAAANRIEQFSSGDHLKVAREE